MKVALFKNVGEIQVNFNTDLHNHFANSTYQTEFPNHQDSLDEQHSAQTKKTHWQWTDQELLTADVQHEMAWQYLVN